MTNKGWQNESRRHSLASRGIKTNVPLRTYNYVPITRNNFENEVEPLIKKYKPVFIGLIDYTAKTGNEYSISICIDNDGATSLNALCHGNNCGVGTHGCQYPSRTYMKFHTHPFPTTLPSVPDLRNAIRSREDFVCIGAPRDPDIGHNYHKIRCYQIIDNPEILKKFMEADIVTATEMINESFDNEQLFKVIYQDWNVEQESGIDIDQIAFKHAGWNPV